MDQFKEIVFNTGAERISHGNQNILFSYDKVKTVWEVHFSSRNCAKKHISIQSALREVHSGTDSCAGSTFLHTQLCQKCIPAHAAVREVHILHTQLYGKYILAHAIILCGMNNKMKQCGKNIAGCFLSMHLS